MPATPGCRPARRSCRSCRARARAACRGGAALADRATRLRELQLRSSVSRLAPRLLAAATATPRASLHGTAPCSGSTSGSTCRAPSRPPRAAQLAQRVLGRLEHVDRVGRAERLREDVADAAELEHRAHAAAGDDAGAGRGRAAAARARRRTSPSDSCVIVCPCLGTVNMFFFASSTAFEIASGTSRALP